MNKHITTNFLVRLGLGVIFIANALVALFAPTEFIEIISNSFLADLLPIPPEVFVPVVIGLNDSIVGLLFIGGFSTRRVAAWAAAWILGVTVIVGGTFDVVEHLGLVFVALALTRDTEH